MMVSFTHRNLDMMKIEKEDIDKRKNEIDRQKNIIDDF